jgi:hypothetical protein
MQEEAEWEEQNTLLQDKFPPFSFSEVTISFLPSISSLDAFFCMCRLTLEQKVHEQFFGFLQAKDQEMKKVRPYSLPCLIHSSFSPFFPCVSTSHLLFHSSLLPLSSKWCGG